MFGGTAMDAYAANKIGIGIQNGLTCIANAIMNLRCDHKWSEPYLLANFQAQKCEKCGFVREINDGDA